VATYEQFKQVFAPFSYEANITMEEHMSEEKKDREEERVIKAKGHKRTDEYTKYSFKLDDDNWYSQFKNNIPTDSIDAIEGLDKGDTVLLKWEPSDCGKYRNFVYAEKIIQRESPPDGSKPSPTPKSTKNNSSDLGMYLCNASNVAGGIYQKLIEKAETADEVTEAIFESLYDMVMMCHNKHRK
jgi:hypothetical protein